MRKQTYAFSLGSEEFGETFHVLFAALCMIDQGDKSVIISADLKPVQKVFLFFAMASLGDAHHRLQALTVEPPGSISVPPSKTTRYAVNFFSELPLTEQQRIQAQFARQFLGLPYYLLSSDRYNPERWKAREAAKAMVATYGVPVTGKKVVIWVRGKEVLKPPKPSVPTRSKKRRRKEEVEKAKEVKETERDMTSEVLQQLAELLIDLDPGISIVLMGDQKHITRKASDALHKDGRACFDLRDLMERDDFKEYAKIFGSKKIAGVEVSNTIAAQLHLMRILQSEFNVQCLMGMMSGGIDGYGYLGIVPEIFFCLQDTQKRMKKVDGVIPGMHPIVFDAAQFSAASTLCDPAMTKLEVHLRRILKIPAAGAGAGAGAEPDSDVDAVPPAPTKRLRLRR